MNSLLFWLTSPEWAIVVKTLLHSLWQGALIAAVLALVLRRIERPAFRYRLALAGLVAIVLSAIVTWSVLSAPKPRPAIELFPATDPPLAAPIQSGPSETIVVIADWTTAKQSIQWTAWIALAWLLGASAMLGRASVKVAGAERLRRGCQPLNDPCIAELVNEARRAVNLARQVRVAVTQQLTSPAVVGVLVPTLILPLSLITTLSYEQIRFILLHELAHIRRGDYLANLFQLFAEALLFFNPAVWWISPQVRREREACCDALAIELSGAPADYARTLVSVAEGLLTPTPSAAPAFGNNREPSSLADRVQRLLVPGYRPSLRLTWRAMLLTLAVGGVTLGLLAFGTRETVAAAVQSVSPSPAEALPAEDSASPSPSRVLTDRNSSITIDPGSRISASTNTNPAPYYGPPVLRALTPNTARDSTWIVDGQEQPNKRWFWYRIGSPGTRTTNSDTNDASSAFHDPLSLEVPSQSDDVLSKRFVYHQAGIPPGTQSFSEREMTLALPPGPHIEPTGFIFAGPPDVKEEERQPAKVSPILLTRTYNLDSHQVAQALKHNNPDGSTNTALALREFITGLGIDLDPPKTMFYRDQPGGLFVRVTPDDVE